MHRSRRKRKKTDDVYVFHCLSNSRKARDSCLPYTMPEKDLIEVLLTMIKSHADVIIGKSLKLRENASEIDVKREAIKREIIALRQEADKSSRMFKSLYENMVSGIITPDEYREMRERYDAKTRENLSRAAELEKQQKELDKQISKYYELSDVVSNTDNDGITAQIIDCLVDKIKIFADRSIEVDFSFDSGFDMISGVIEDE